MLSQLAQLADVFKPARDAGHSGKAVPLQGITTHRERWDVSSALLSCGTPSQMLVQQRLTISVMLRCLRL